MNEQTQRLIAALLSTPELVQELRRDPVGFSTKVLTGQVSSPAVEAVKQLVAGLSLSRAQAARTAVPALSKALPAVNGGIWNTLESATEGVPIVGVVSLGAIIGSLVVLSAVCIAAIADDD
jgi:hypothetical protein